MDRALFNVTVISFGFCIANIFCVMYAALPMRIILFAKPFYTPTEGHIFVFLLGHKIVA